MSGQWVRTLKRPANLRGRAHSEKGARIDYQAPYRSAYLYAPVPAHYEAHSSDYTYCFLSPAYK